MKKADHQLKGLLKAYKSSGNSVVIEGFANAATVDRAKELIAPDAFTKTGGLNNFMKNPTIYFDHGMDPNVGGLPVGKAVEVTPTEKGLFIKAKISQAKDPPISTIRTLIEEGNLRAFSVGYNPEDIEPDKEKGVNVIKAAELYEVSVVGLPMNQDSLFAMSSKECKKFMTKSLNQIKAAIANDKGCQSAANINLALEKKAADGADRAALLEEISAKANVSIFSVYDCLNGDIEAPTILKAASEILDAPALLDTSDKGGDKEPKPKDDDEEDKGGGKKPKEKDEDQDDDKGCGDKKPKKDEEKKGDKGKTTAKTGKGSGANDHTHEAVFDSETGNGSTSSTEGDGPDHKHSIEKFEILAGGEDSHTHPAVKAMDSEDKPKDKEDDEGDEESKEKKDFQQCVSEKIPKLIEEGKEQDEAVAAAIAFCRDEKGCNISPDKAMYADFFKNAEEAAAKQAGEGMPEPTTAIDTSPPEEPSTPFLDQQKQTNVLLGSMVNEFKLFANAMSGMTEELAGAIRQLASALGTQGAPEEPGSEEGKEAEDFDINKRVERAKNYLTKLDKRLKDLGV